MNDAFKLYEQFRLCFLSFYSSADAVLRYLKDTIRALGNFIFFYLLLCVFFYIVIEKYTTLSYVNKFFKNFRRVLIVTAHPDDECMFFGPFIINLLKKSDRKVFLLCLSNGDHDKLGSVRKQELWDSCVTLGMNASNIYLCKHSDMQDNPNVIWKKEDVAETILEFTASLDIDTIVTFDGDGVSGHYNHISIFNAVCFLVMKSVLPSNTNVYVLESVNLFRKYTACMDTLLTYLTSGLVSQIKHNEQKIINRAMKKHKSQSVWFRKLYMKCSRYVYINSFRHLDSSSAFLEMDDFNVG